MKHLQYVAAILFTLAGIALLCAPAHAATPARTPTLLKIEDSRHFILYDQPAAFDAVVEGF